MSSGKLTITEDKYFFKKRRDKEKLNVIFSNSDS